MMRNHENIEFFLNYAVFDPNIALNTQFEKNEKQNDNYIDLDPLMTNMTVFWSPVT